MKKLIALLLCLAMAALLPSPVLAQTAVPYIVDDADLLTDSQEEALNRMAENIASEYRIRPIIVTVDSLGGRSVVAYADDYYDYHYGYPNGVLLLLAMDTREWAISTCGEAIYALTDYGLDELFGSMAGYLAEDEYYTAFQVYLDEMPLYFDAYRSGHPIDVPAGGSYLRIALVSLLLGAAVGGLSLLGMRSMMNTAKAQYSAGSYMVSGSYHLARHRDIFLYSRVSRVRRAENNGGGGRGGGSSVHRSSSGRSHGGRHGRF